MRLAGVDTPVGVLDMNNGLFRFAYGKSWLANDKAFAIDPINLPLSEKVYSDRFLWHCFEDALPDRWGQRVVLALHRQPPRNLIEWLISARGAGVGALRFSGALSKVLPDAQIPDYEDLKDLMALAEAIDRGEMTPDSFDPRLAKALWHGSSMGGGRPKVVVMKDGLSWIAKLGASNDQFDQVRAEYAFMKMAGDCGLHVEDCELDVVAGQPVFFAKRFDQSSHTPVHYLSACALVNLHRVNPNDMQSRASYSEIAHLIRKISAAPKQDLSELYGRMTFNVLIGNTDDHMKNHGFLHAGKGLYRLSPAFDILPHPGQVQQHALIIGAHGFDSSLENLLSDVSAYGLNKDEAQAIIDRQIDVIGKSASYFKQAGISQQDEVILNRACRRLFESKCSAASAFLQ